MQAQREGIGMALIIHNFCTRSGEGGGVVNATPQLLYSFRKETRYLLYRRLSRPCGKSGKPHTHQDSNSGPSSP